MPTPIYNEPELEYSDPSVAYSGGSPLAGGEYSDPSITYSEPGIAYDGGAPAGIVSFPQVVVEFGFNSNPTTQYLTLDDPVRGVLNVDALAPTAGVWVDLSSRVYDITTSRGRNRLLSAYKTGSATLVLDNADGALDPNNLNGPYVSGGATQVVPNVAVRVRAVLNGVYYPVFQGTVDSWAPDWPAPTGRSSRITAVCSDGFKMLTAFTPAAASAPAGANEGTGARISRLAAAASWPADQQSLDTGDSALQATTQAQNILTEIQQSVDSEWGAVYIDPTGVLTFEHRNGLIGNSRSNTAQSTFDDEGGFIPYEKFTPIYQDDLLRNTIYEQAVGGVLQSVVDGASQTNNYSQVWNKTDLLLQYDSDAGEPAGLTSNPGSVLDHANWLLYLFKDPEFRVDKLSLSSESALADNQNGNLYWGAVLGRKIRDRIRVLFHPPISEVFDKQLYVEGIDHQIGMSAGSPQTWKTDFYTSSASKYDGMFVLDSVTLGVLDRNDLAGW